MIINGYDDQFFLEKVDICSGSVMSISGQCTVVESGDVGGGSGWGEIFNEVGAKKDCISE